MRQTWTEFDAQQHLVRLLKAEGLEFDHPPIVAVGPHAGDPHFAPQRDIALPIGPGDLVLTDLWAHEAHRPDGGLGAYAAGILAYGGWGIVDIIMNPIAGGVANAMLPAILFRMYRVDPTLGAQRPADVLSGVVKAVVLAIIVLAAGYLNRFLQWSGQWGFILPLIALFVGARVLLGGLALNKASFLAAVGIAVVSCAASALIGAIGATVGGKPFAAALVDPGIGWFIGDTISAFLGLYLLAMFTQRARAAGIVAS